MDHNVSGFRAGVAVSESAARSGTTVKMSPLTATVPIVRNSNRLRQPRQFTNQSVGAVAVTAPSDPNMIMQPLTSATRSFGNQVTMDLSPAINEQATTSPIMARATRSSGKL